MFVFKQIQINPNRFKWIQTLPCARPGRVFALFRCNEDAADVSAPTERGRGDRGQRSEREVGGWGGGGGQSHTVTETGTGTGR